MAVAGNLEHWKWKHTTLLNPLDGDISYRTINLLDSIFGCVDNGLAIG